MLEALLTLMVLASGTSGTDTINASSSYYNLELAFEQAHIDAALYEEAVALQMAQANERVAEAQASHGQGDTASAAAALNAYNHVLDDLAMSLVAADALDDEALLAQLDADLAAQDQALAGIEPQQDDPQATDEPDNGSACERDDHPVATRIAEALGLSYDQVLAMFCADGDAKLGFGQIMMAARLSEASGKSLDEILAMRASGMGWGQIKKELGVTNPNGKPGKNCPDHPPKDGINDDTGEPCPPKGNGNGNANGNGNGGGNGKNCPDKDPKDGKNDETGEPCPPDDDDEGEDDGDGGTAEPTESPTDAPTQQP